MRRWEWFGGCRMEKGGEVKCGVGRGSVGVGWKREERLGVWSWEWFGGCRV